MQLEKPVQLEKPAQLQYEVRTKDKNQAPKPSLEAAALVQQGKSQRAAQELRSVRGTLAKLREKRKKILEKILAIDEQIRESRESIAQLAKLEAALLLRKRAHESCLQQEKKNLLGDKTQLESEIANMEVQEEDRRSLFAQEQAKASALERHIQDHEHAVKQGRLAAELEHLQEEQVIRSSFSKDPENS